MLRIPVHVHVGIVRINRQEGVGMKAREASEKDQSTKIRRIACCQVPPALDFGKVLKYRYILTSRSLLFFCAVEKNHIFYEHPLPKSKL